MRTRSAIVAVAAACCLVVTSCQLHLTTPSGSGQLRYRDEIFTEVTKTADVTYGQAADLTGTMKTLKLDIYEPTGDTVTKRPAIVWVHGGSFKAGSKTSAEIVDQAKAFAKMGYFNVSISYRLSSGGCAPFTSECIDAIEMAYHDAQAAVRFLRAKANVYGIDTGRIAVAGSSAGGITAYNVAYGSDKVGHSGNPGYSSKVQAAVSLSGAAITTGPDAGEPPTMNFHGAADQIVPLAWSDTTIKNAKAAKLTAERTVWSGDGHVPYAKHRTEIIEQSRNFLYHAMKLGSAAR